MFGKVNSARIYQHTHQNKKNKKNNNQNKNQNKNNNHKKNILIQTKPQILSSKPKISSGIQSVQSVQIKYPLQFYLQSHSTHESKINQTHPTLPNTTQSKLISPNTSKPFYINDNIHSYTPQIQNIVEIHKKSLQDENGTEVDQKDFDTLITDMEKYYGEKKAFSNFKTHYKKGGIHDPELPQLNVAVLLKTVWIYLQKNDDSSMYKHFGETLDQIDLTCMTGISHRLFMDYIMLKEILTDKSIL